MSKPKYISQEQQETFERFLMGDMNTREQERFKKELDANQDLKTQFEDFKDLFSVIEETALKDTLDEFHSTVSTSDRGHVKSQKSRFYLIAASVTIFLLLGSFWFFNRQTPGEKIYTKYYTPDPGLPTVMSDTEDYEFYEAMVDYKQENYNTAISKWEELLKTKPENDTLNYFLGVSHLANKDLSNASFYLDKVKNAEASVFYKDANFYFGLLQFKAGDFDKAKEALRNSDSDISKEILKNLE